jgi:hypothetical protein
MRVLCVQFHQIQISIGFLLARLWSCGHNVLMSQKRRVHITLPDPLANALEALAEIEGRSFSDLLEELGRAELRSRGLLPQVSGKELVAQLKRGGGKKRRK